MVASDIWRTLPGFERVRRSNKPRGKRRRRSAPRSLALPDPCSSGVGIAQRGLVTLAATRCLLSGNRTTPSDGMFVEAGVTICMDPATAQEAHGTAIDFEDTEDSGRLHIQKARGQGGCGCGGH